MPNVYKNVYKISPNFSDYVVLKSKLDPEGSTYLIDTQADISLIRASAISCNFNWKNKINTSNIINIKGITQNSIRSLGTISVNFYVKNNVLPCTLHVVPDDFNIPSDGILGKDFIKYYRCNIDYDSMLISINTPYDSFSLPILEGPGDNIVLPARSEVIRTFTLKSENPCLIVDQEISPGVLIPKTIVSSKNPLVRVMNTTNQIQIIPKNVILETENLSDYSVYHINENNTGSSRLKKLLKTLSKNVKPQYKEKLLNLCKEYADIFHVEGDKLTTNNFYEQKLRIKDDSPVYIKNYRNPHSMREEINSQVNKLLENDLIEPSKSNYNSPVILLHKKSSSGQKFRMCIDYRFVNKKLIADKYPLSRIEDILDNLGRAKLFSVIDLQSGFHQIPLEEASRDITSFSTERGSFRFKVLPFGLSVSPNSFSRMMALAFSGVPPLTCFLYMDDVIVLGCSEKHHLKNLQNVFDVCRKYNLKLNPEKCKFFNSEVTYLGHKCTDQGIFPDDSKIEAVKNYPVPTNKDQVKRFVAFMNYYRRFVSNFAALAKPLNFLTRKNSKFIWSDECKQSFENLRNAVIQPPILKYPDFSKQFVLLVDASKDAVGATLAQEYDGKFMPVSYASRGFTKGEMNKSTIEKELAAIHFAVLHYKPYIYGTHFLIKSDHKPLTYLFSLKNPTSKLTRMRLDLEEFSYTVEYIKGKSNVIADALSRLTSNELKLLNECNEKVAQVSRVETRSMTKKNQNRANDSNTQTNEKQNSVKESIMAYEDKNNFKLPKMVFKINKMHLKVFLKRKTVIKIDENYIIGTLLNQNNNLKTTSKEEVLVLFLKKLEKEAVVQKLNIIQIFNEDEIFHKFTINEFKIMCNKCLKNVKIAIVTKPKIVITQEEKADLLELYHKNPIFGGHTGQKRMYNKLRSLYFWKNMSKDIAGIVKNCDQCSKNKPKNKTREPLVISKTPEKCFDTVVIDTIGPLQRSENGNQYALTLICNLSKYLISIPIQNKEAKTVAKAIVDNCILTFGPMNAILSDRGTEYVNSIIKELCNLLQIEHKTSTAYHHQTLGSIERNHRVLNEYLRTFCKDNQNNWDNYIRYFTYCYNTTPHTSFKFNYSPFELIFGKIPKNHDFLKNNQLDPLYNFDDYVKELKFQLQSANKLANQFLEITKNYNKIYYDKKLNELNIKPNDEVLLTNDAGGKFDSLYSGPYLVKTIEGVNAIITNPQTQSDMKVHKNRLIKYKQ